MMGTRLFVAFLLAAAFDSSAVHQHLRLRGRQTNGSLFGSKLSGKSVANETSPRSLKPLYYLHVPKCGSSFATALAHYGCGNRLPRDERVKDPGSEEGWNRKCPPQKGEPRAFGWFRSGHRWLEKKTDLSKVAVIFREPKTRTMSGYFAQPERLHDCSSMKKKYCVLRNPNTKDYTCQGDLPGKKTNPNVIPIREYAQCVGSCATNMLTGKECGYGGRPNTQAALAMIPKLGFFGLTHEWDLSMCLFHAMYGGPCLAAEFSNLRPGPVSDYSKYFASMQGLTLGDTVVYSKAQTVFWQRMRKYGVNRASCHDRICNSPATQKFFQIPSNLLNVSKGGQSNTTFDYDWPGRFFYDEDYDED